MSRTQVSRNLLSAYLNLARVRIAYMVVVSCAIGYILAAPKNIEPLGLLWTLLGTALMSCGACTFNCYIERETDALMPRTSNRPIPQGVISPADALWYGSTLVVAGFATLLQGANLLSALLGAAAVFSYVGIYTPAKRLTWWNTSIGAIPGAIPPLIGWAGATGQLTPGAWILFAMLFVWQHTHFFPIAWLFKDDYRQGGFKMLPVLESRGEKTFLLTVISAVLLLPISMSLHSLSVTGSAYCMGALVFGCLLIAAGVRLSKQPSRANAQAVLMLSLFYLPVLLAAVIVDRYAPLLGTQVQGLWEIVCKWT